MTPKHLQLDDPSLYLNRELSLLEFHARVLEQVRDARVPLLERLRFLSICTKNLDEFFEIRVSGLQQQLAYGVPRSEPDGMSVKETLGEIRSRVETMVEDQYRLLNEVLLPEMEREGIFLLKREDWNERQQRWIKRYFRSQVLPVLTPVGLDPAHPFPRVLNKSLNFIVEVTGEDAFGRSSGVAVLQVPRSLPRMIALPAKVVGGPHGFVMISSVIHAHVAEVFPGMQVQSCAQFRVTRNSDLWVDEEEVDDLMRALQGELRSRHYGDAVRLEVADNCNEEMARTLLELLNLGQRDLYRVNGPVNLHRLEAIYGHADRPDLKYRPFVPGTLAKVDPGGNLFELLRKQDVLLHHPFESFAPVVDLLRQAAADPQVLAIKQTLYRTDPRSPVVEALIDAARAGKEVTVVVELRARFDEAANIKLAHRLQEAGANVVYGVVGFKSHAKLLLVVRREGRTLRRYAHLGTGNYHTTTARHYTDIGLLTANPALCRDVHQIFIQLTGPGAEPKLEKTLQSPFTLHRGLMDMIEAETENARAGEPARIIAKMNSLSEPSVIEALYVASRAGVEIDLIVRGLCCLRPGVKGVSENIRVRSIVGRFLEHSRISYFFAGGAERLFCSSADWMQRNLFRRVEACFPIEAPELAARLKAEGLEVYLEPGEGVWELASDGTYSRSSKPAGPAAQERLLLLLADPRGQRAGAEGSEGKVLRMPRKGRRKHRRGKSNSPGDRRA